ncbi:MAG: hypothetical protein LBC37_05715 [Zoogloeaceae bacterium]|nr:hypothetical protein [Zoogloeaceae bacterium]
MKKRQKVKTYFLPVSYSKKGQAELALFWWKSNENPLLPIRPVVGAHCVRPSAVTRRDDSRARAARPYKTG